MTLVYTCELSHVNTFDYLTDLLRHAQELAANPVNWTPWTYRTALERSCSNPYYYNLASVQPCRKHTMLRVSSPEPSASPLHAHEALGVFAINL